MLNRFFTEYFGFNKQQRSGLLVLLFISFSLLLVRLVYPKFMVPAAIDVSYLPLYERQLDSFESATYSSRHTNRRLPSSHLFVFNPNQVRYSQLLELGFHPKTAKGFVKYRTKGFVFRKKEDVKTVYGVSEQFYNELEPYILIEPTLPKEPIARQKQVVKPQQLVDLNTADSLTLVALRGIGPSYAKRILKYRSLLGGYVTIEQLKEVYGFTDEIYNSIKGLFTIGNGHITTINVNKDDFKGINKHPYISYEQTKLICNQRRQTPLTAEKLKEIIADDAVFSKLAPYLVY